MQDKFCSHSIGSLVVSGWGKLSELVNCTLSGFFASANGINIKMSFFEICCKPDYFDSLLWLPKRDKKDDTLEHLKLIREYLSHHLQLASCFIGVKYRQFDEVPTFSTVRSLIPHLTERLEHLSVVGHVTHNVIPNLSSQWNVAVQQTEQEVE